VAVWLALAALAVAGSGCRGESEPAALQAHRALAERVSRVMDDLQKRRTAIQAESDVGEAFAGLRVNQEPPAPMPVPVVEVAEDPAGDPAGDASPEAPPPPPIFRLQGIVWHPTAPLAIVNKRTVGVGESVDGGRVERITRDGAVLVGPGGETLELRLYEPAPQQP
jgi:hypothetical protein